MVIIEYNQWINYQDTLLIISIIKEGFLNNLILYIENKIYIPVLNFYDFVNPS